MPFAMCHLPSIEVLFLAGSSQTQMLPTTLMFCYEFMFEKEKHNIFTTKTNGDDNQLNKKSNTFEELSHNFENLVAGFHGNIFAMESCHEH